MSPPVVERPGSEEPRRPAPSARVLRRRRRRARQTVVFSVLIALVALAGGLSAAAYFGVVDAPFDQPFRTPEPEAGPAVPCPPDGALPVAYVNVHVAVLNTTDRGGLAAGVAAELTTRGFTVQRTGNAAGGPATTELRFGSNGVAAAYTLAAQLGEPVLTLDARADDSVDLLLGDGFTQLVDVASVGLDPDVPLTGRPGCEDSVQPLQPAPSAPSQSPASAAPPA